VLDPVTAIQFASVYRNFSDLDELEAEVRRLKAEAFPGSDQLPLEPAVPSGSKSNIDLSPAATAGEDRGARSTRRRSHA
jgi:hypothetical protein